MTNIPDDSYDPRNDPEFDFEPDERGQQYQRVTGIIYKIGYDAGSAKQLFKRTEVWHEGYEAGQLNAFEVMEDANFGLDNKAPVKRYRTRQQFCESRRRPPTSRPRSFAMASR